MHKFVVLISGNGTNLEAICKAGLAINIAAVISNKSCAKGLDIATKYNIPTHIIDHRNFKSRDEFDNELIMQIEAYTPEFIVLAGFMRILTTKFVTCYQNRLLNIHPSLLPSFIGSNAKHEALQKKVKVTGVTVHFVTDTLDSGPIIAQGIIPLHYNDTEETLNTRTHELEHIIYPFVIKKYLTNEISIDVDGNVIVKHDSKDKVFMGKFNDHIFY